uniref:Major sperm protein n=1 Tax=Panagrolaimus superbus TaxID=310955 RepID=A0A914Z6P8_9BILA
MSEPEQSKSPQSTPAASAAVVSPSNSAAAEQPVKSVTASETSDPAAGGGSTVNQQPATVPNPPSVASPVQPAAPGIQLSEKKEQPIVITPVSPQQVPPSAAATTHQQQPVTSSPSHAHVQSPQTPLSAVPALPRSSSPAPKAIPTLCINPNKAVFTTAGGVSKHLMINKSNQRLAIKIRSSNNFFFRVNPVYSFLDCNAVNELEVIRLVGGGAKQDKLQVIYVTCTENDTDATKLFGLRAHVRSVILPIVTTAVSSL